VIARKEIISEARSWIDTPYQHQGRLKGAGVDCVGVVIKVAHELGMSKWDITNYSPSPSNGLLLSEARKHMDEIAPTDARPGDWLVMKFHTEPQHLMLLTEPDLVLHAYAGAGRCIEVNLIQPVKNRIVTALRYRGIEPWLD
jgi:cell wall-associated NlpC family hydrolase